MVDGFGFCYYWVIEELIEKDLFYKFSLDGCIIMEILIYIYGFLVMVYNSVFQLFNKCLVLVVFEDFVNFR